MELQIEEACTWRAWKERMRLNTSSLFLSHSTSTAQLRGCFVSRAIGLRYATSTAWLCSDHIRWTPFCQEEESWSPVSWWFCCPHPVSLSKFWGIYTEPRLMALRHLSPRCPPRHGYYPEQLLGHWKAGIPASCPWSLQAWGASAISVPIFGEMGITELLPCHVGVWKLLWLWYTIIFPLGLSTSAEPIH